MICDVPQYATLCNVYDVYSVLAIFSVRLNVIEYDFVLYTYFVILHCIV